MKDIIIIGAGDFGKEVAWLIEGINRISPSYKIVGFLDDDIKKTGMEINGYKCLGDTGLIFDLSKNKNFCAVIAIQDGSIRRQIVERLAGFENWETLIHPTANVSGTSELGKGCIICAENSISVNTKIGNHCVFNISAITGHDCMIDDYVSVMSGACVCGHVTIGKETYLATNCTVVPGKKIGCNAVVGAGSVVLRNVKENVTVMGVPAKVFKFV